MSKIDTGGPVYPIWTPDMNLGDTAGPGMSKREYFAGQAIGSLTEQEKNEVVDVIAEICVMQADALIAALKGDG